MEILARDTDGDRPDFKADDYYPFSVATVYEQDEQVRAAFPANVTKKYIFSRCRKTPSPTWLDRLLWREST